MVTVSNVLQREGENGPFALLELQGGLELVQSSQTGRFYATVRKCTIPCTMGFEEAKAFVGKGIPGTIQRVECEPYKFTDPKTGEVLEMAHRWEFVPEMNALAPVVEMPVSQRA